MSYKEFSIESVITRPEFSSGYEMNGIGRINQIYDRSNKRSTESFVQDAVGDLGKASQNIMFANMTVSAFEDRFRAAAKIANSINQQKARGTESFRYVEYLDPYKYAIEGKVGDFFKKVWDAIKSAARRIVTAIANFIRWISNKISDAGTKAEVKDYKFYKDNAEDIMAAARLKKVDDIQFNSYNWTVDGNGLANIITKTLGGLSEVINDKIIKERTDKLQAAIESVGNSKDLNQSRTTIQEIAQNIDTWTAEADSLYELKIAESFPGAKSIVDKKERFSPKMIVNLAVTNEAEPKIGKVTCKFMREKSNDFYVLSQEWLTINFKNVLGSAHDTQKAFADFTKSVDKMSGTLEKLITNAEKEEYNQIKKDDKEAAGKYEWSKNAIALSRYASKYCTARSRTNTLMTTVQLQLEAMAFRFRKSAHIALKQYLKSYKGYAKGSGKTEPKTEKAE